MNNGNLKQIAVALIMGLGLSLSSLIYARQSTITKQNDCVGLCAAWVSMEVEAKVRGLPLGVIITENPDSENESTQINWVNGIGNWLIYSSLIFAVTSIRKRKLNAPKNPK